MERRRRDGTRDVVLFVANEQWHCFDQLAAALRRRGLRPVRVVTSGRRGVVTRLVDRWLYCGVIHLGRRGAAAKLERLAADRRVLDVQVDERTFATMDRDTPVARQLADLDPVPWARRAVYYDKVALAEELGRHGIGVAPVLRADRTTPAAAIDRMGLPIVVKRRTGTGGREVRVVHHAAELPTTVAALGADEDVLYQPFLASELLGYGAAVRNGVPVQECVALERKSRADPLGPTAWIHPRDDDRLRRAGRAVAQIIAPDGLFSVEFLQTPAGDLQVIDVSVRAWGSFMAWTDIGLDLGAGYLDAIGATPMTGPSVSHGGSAPIAVLPVAIADVAYSKSWLGATRATAHLARRYAPHVGARYGALVTTRLTLDRLRRRRSPTADRPATTGPVEALTPAPVIA